MKNNTTASTARGARGGRAAGGTAAKTTRGRGGSAAQQQAPAPIEQNAGMDYTKANKLRIAALKRSISAAEKVGKAFETQINANKVWLETLVEEQKQLETA